MFRSAFDDGFYVYSYIPAREKLFIYTIIIQQLYNLCKYDHDQRHIYISTCSLHFYKSREVKFAS